MLNTDVPEQHVIDFGAHIYPEAYLPGSDDNPDADLNEMLGPIHYDPNVLLEHMDTANIDQAVVSSPYYIGQDDAEMVAEVNDALLEMVEDEDRFYGLAAVPTAAGGEAAATELERALEAGYHGGAIETSSDGIELTDEAVEPILEVADSYGAPLLVHPKIDDSLHPEVLDDTYQLNAIFGREAALSQSLCTAIHTGLYDRYDDLNLVYHHLGGNIAGMLGRVHLRLDQGRWPGQESVKSYTEFKKQLEERVYLDTSGFFGYHYPVQAAVSELPSTQIVFGTDVPYEARNGEELGEFANSIEDTTSTIDASRILGGNTLDLLINLD
jgi:predicted TIM-barrel fold metal-dependent hydrolase